MQSLDKTKLVLMFVRDSQKETKNLPPERTFEVSKSCMIPRLGISHQESGDLGGGGGQ